MKRFTLFLALLVSFTWTALAQTLVTDLSTLDESQNVFLKTSERGGLSLNAAKDALTSTKQAGVGNDYVNGRVLFNIKKYNNGTEKYLYSVVAGKYINNSGNLTDNPATVDAVEFVQGTGNTFVIRFNIQNQEGKYEKFINLNNEKDLDISGWGPGGTNPNGCADEGNCFSIYTVDNSLAEVTFNYEINSTSYTSITEKYRPIAGTTINVPSAPFFTPTTTSVTLTEELTQNFTIAGTESLPFVKSTVENPVWQAVKIHKDVPKWLSANSERSGIVFANTSTDIVPEDAYFWCFVGDLINGFTIYNKAVGTASPLKAGDAPLFDNSSDANPVWKLKPNKFNDTDWFCLYGDNKKYINVGGKQYYEEADGGSSMKAYSLASLVFSQDVKDAAVAPVNAVGNYAYVKDASQREALVNAVNAFEANNNNVEVARTLYRIATAMKATPRNTFGTGYYRFYSAKPALYNSNKGVFFNGDNFVWGSIDKRTVAHILKIEESSDNDKPYVIYTCNDKKYMQGVAGDANTTTSTNSKFKLVALEGAIQQHVVFGDGTLHAKGHNEGPNGNLINYPYETVNSASAWYIVPATDIEVVLNTVGDASYATTYLPFAVEGDGETKLYKGSVGKNALNEDVLKMNEVSGVIQKETALVLKGAADDPSTTLTIRNEEGNEVGENDLQGTLTDITFSDNRSSYLVLGVGNSSQKIGFYTPSVNLTAIGQNKAYLYASAVGTANAIALNFEDVTTGISLTEINGENAPVYDLSGRRVLRTVKGGLYIQNGKKYIVK